MKTNLKLRTQLSAVSMFMMMLISTLFTTNSSTAQDLYHRPINSFVGFRPPSEIHLYQSSVKQKVSARYFHDYLLPGKGKSMVSLYTGLPYAAVGEYAYGFSDRFSAGVFFGYTPVNHGYGLRLKAAVTEPAANFRINLKTTIIYYPFMEFGEGDPWALGWQAANAEWKLKNGSHVWVGAGILGVSCIDDLFPSKKMMKKEPEGEEEEMEMEGVFNTFQFGYSKPISNHSSIVIEVAPVMEGFKLKSKSGFLDSFPVIVTAAFTHSF